MPKKTSDATDGDAVTPERDDAVNPESGDAVNPERDEAATPADATPEGPDADGRVDDAAEPEADPGASDLAPEDRRGLPAMGMGEGSAETDAPAGEVGADIAEPNPDPDTGSLRSGVDGDRAAGTEDHDLHEDTDEGGSSLATRALLALILLLVGIAIGIWGAPRLAPMLPAGMAPVADWLSPDRRLAQDRIAVIEADLDETRGRLDALPSEPQADPRVDTMVAEAETRLSASIAGLEERIEGIDATIASLDTEEIRQRMARLESTLQGQSSELASLKEQLSSRAETAQPSEETAAQLSQNAEQIDLYRAEIEGLRGELGAVTDQLSSLQTRIGEVASASEQRVAAAQDRAAQVEEEAQTAVDSAAAEADLSRISAAIANGEPFAEPLEGFTGLDDVDVPEALVESAPVGVETLTELRESFSTAAHQAIRAAIRDEAGDGIAARSQAFLQSQIASRSLSPQEGTDADAVLSRMEAALAQGNVDAALAESSALPHAAMVAMASWLGAAQQRVAVKDGLAALTADLSTSN